MSIKTHSREQPRLAFIGGGHMASAMIGGLIAAGQPQATICVADPDADRRAWLSAQWPDVAVVERNSAALDGADIAVLAVKPDRMPAVARALSDAAGDICFLSVAAGVPAGRLSEWLGTRRIVRAMPNQGATVGRSATGLFALDELSTRERALVDKIASSIGDYVWVEEETAIDTITAISGSGPAYFFLLMERLVAEACALGLTPEQAQRLVQATAAGAAELAGASNAPPAELRARVTSPGGTTEAAVRSMQRDDIDGLIHRAVIAAHARARALADDAAQSPT